MLIKKWFLYIVALLLCVSIVQLDAISRQALEASKERSRVRASKRNFSGRLINTTKTDTTELENQFLSQATEFATTIYSDGKAKLDLYKRDEKYNELRVNAGLKPIRLVRRIPNRVDVKTPSSVTSTPDAPTPTVEEKEDEPTPVAPVVETPAPVAPAPVALTPAPKVMTVTAPGITTPEVATPVTPAAPTTPVAVVIPIAPGGRVSIPSIAKIVKVAAPAAKSAIAATVAPVAQVFKTAVVAAPTRAVSSAIAKAPARKPAPTKIDLNKPIVDPNATIKSRFFGQSSMPAVPVYTPAAAIRYVAPQQSPTSAAIVSYARPGDDEEEWEIEED